MTFSAKSLAGLRGGGMLASTMTFGLRCVMLVAAAALVLGCGNSSGPSNRAILGDRVTLPGQPYGAAISASGVAYITLGSASKLARTDLPSESFAPAVNVGTAPSEGSFTSTSTLAYVTNQLSQYVGVVEVASNLEIDTIPTHGDPFEIIVQPGDSIIYVSTNVNWVYGIRLATKAIVDSFPTPA